MAFVLPTQDEARWAEARVEEPTAGVPLAVNDADPGSQRSADAFAGRHTDTSATGTPAATAAQLQSVDDSNVASSAATGVRATEDHAAAVDLPPANPWRFLRPEGLGLPYEATPAFTSRFTLSEAAAARLEPQLLRLQVWSWWCDHVHPQSQRTEHTGLSLS